MWSFLSQLPSTDTKGTREPGPRSLRPDGGSERTAAGLALKGGGGGARGHRGGRGRGAGRGRQGCGGGNLGSRGEPRRGRDTCSHSQWWGGGEAGPPLHPRLGLQCSPAAGSGTGVGGTETGNDGGSFAPCHQAVSQPWGCARGGPGGPGLVSAADPGQEGEAGRAGPALTAGGPA